MLHALGRSLLLILALLSASAATAQRGTPQLPEPVRPLFTGAAAQCREIVESGRPGRLSLSADPKFVEEADLNGDGRPDYVVSFEALRCDNAASLYCGSAGCGYYVILSAGTGYRPAEQIDAQSLDIDRSTTPIQLRLSRHGSACGRSGAEGCRSVLAWNGRALGPVTARRPATPAAPPSAVPPAGTAWTVIRSRTGSPIARTEPGRGIVSIELACFEGKVAMSVRLPRAIGPRLALAVATGGGGAQPASYRAVLQPLGNQGSYAAVLPDRRLPDMLAGAATGAQFVVAGATVPVPLAGSTAAFREALAACYAPAAAAPARVGPAPRIPWTARPGRPAPGIYTPVAEFPCKELRWYSFYWSSIASPFRVEEGDDFNGLPIVMTPRGFYYREDPATRYERCDEAQLHPDARIWKKAAYRKVAALPIKPGIYRAVDEAGKPIPSKDNDLAGYFLFEPTRFAYIGLAYDKPGQPRNVNTVKRFRKLIQVGEGTYSEDIGADDSVGDSMGATWHVEAPDRFAGVFGEFGMVWFVPVAPATVPSAQKPRW